MQSRFLKFGRIFFLIISLSFASLASAHSTVSPSQTLVSKYETFSLSVPTEKDVPTTLIRLNIPASLDKVTPFVKPGWKIAVKKDSAGKVTEIEWSGGFVPAGQKDVFQFTARTGTTPDTLIWKVYQTYQSGEVVAWDKDPKTPMTGNEMVSNPYSVTEVLSSAPVVNNKSSSSSTTPLTISIVALVLSIIAMGKSRKLAN